jgi:predicted choloylglycine hydrolase
MMEESRHDYVLLMKDGKYIGYITKSTIMDAYRQNLKKLVNRRTWKYDELQQIEFEFSPELIEHLSC